MSDVVKNIVFREPEGRLSGAIWLVIAAVAYVWMTYDLIRFGHTLDIPVILGTSFTLFGIAELLPKHRNRLAGSVRMAAVVVAIFLIILL